MLIAGQVHLSHRYPVCHKCLFQLSASLWEELVLPRGSNYNNFRSLKLYPEWPVGPCTIDVPVFRCSRTFLCCQGSEREKVCNLCIQSLFRQATLRKTCVTASVQPASPTSTPSFTTYPPSQQQAGLGPLRSRWPLNGAMLRIPYWAHNGIWYMAPSMLHSSFRGLESCVRRLWRGKASYHYQQ